MSEKTKKEPITYSRYGDYLIPNLILDNGKVRPKIGRYGRLRLKFLKTCSRLWKSSYFVWNHTKTTLYKQLATIQVNWKSVTFITLFFF